MEKRYKLVGHEDEIVTAYQSGQPTTLIAQRFGVSATSVNQLLKKVGIPRRDMRASHPTQSYCRYGHSLFGENLYTTRRGTRGCRACRRAWHAKHPQTEEQKKRSREWAIKKRREDPEYQRNADLWSYYRLTRAEFNQKLIAQKKCCAICNQLMEKPCVDHRHNTFQVRDLVCRNCNLAIGHVRENIEVAESLVAYLKKWKPDATLVGTPQAAILDRIRGC
jgi:hypothetical protein